MVLSLVEHMMLKGFGLLLHLVRGSRTGAPPPGMALARYTCLGAKPWKLNLCLAQQQRVRWSMFGVTIGGLGTLSELLLIDRQ